MQNPLTRRRNWLILLIAFAAPLPGCFLGVIAAFLPDSVTSPARSLELALQSWLMTLPVSVPLALVGHAVLTWLKAGSWLPYALMGLALSPLALAGTISLLISPFAIANAETLFTLAPLALWVSFFTALIFRAIIRPPVHSPAIATAA